MNVAKWSVAPHTPSVERIERHLRCLACNGPVETPLAALGSLRCLSCREADAPLDPSLFSAGPTKSP
jgi:hypothetical protein